MTIWTFPCFHIIITLNTQLLLSRFTVIKYSLLAIYLIYILELSTQFAALALAQLPAEPFFHEMMQAVAQRFKFHGVDYLVDEGELK